MSQNKKLLIIDGNSLIHRAFHALPPLTNRQGLVVNAIYGFFSILFKIIKEKKFEYIVVAFDLPTPTFRHKIYKEYKIQRIKQPQELYNQIPIIQKILQALGIPCLSQEGYEADDIIATLVEKNKNLSDFEITILTGDLDTLQLVDSKTKVFAFKQGISQVIEYDEKKIWEKFGLTPSQLKDFKALKGDPSDNILGVPGVGEKTALKLIREYQSLENLYETLEKCQKKECSLSPKLQNLLREGKEKAFLSKKLVTLEKSLPLQFSLEESFFKNKIQPKEIEKIFSELDLKTLWNRFQEIFLSQEKSGALPIKQTKIITLDSKNIQKFINECLQKKFLATILSEKTPGVLFAFSEKEIYFCPVSDFQAKDNPIKKIFENPAIEKIIYDSKNFLKYLNESDVKLKNFQDLLILSHLSNPDFKDHNLETLIWQINPHLSQEWLKKNDLEAQAFKITFFFALKEKFWEKINEQNLVSLYRNIELPLIPVLACMEKRGIKIDREALKTITQFLDKRIAELKKEIFALAGEEFNLNSPAQLKKILFQKLKITEKESIPKMKFRKTKNGLISTSASQLEKLRNLHPIIDLIFEYREMAKIRSTYTENLTSFLNPLTLRLHTTFNQTMTATGRLSSTNPNLQNIPIRSPIGKQIRQAFVAEKNFLFVSADYSQIELRVAAALSKDPEMIKAFKEDIDFHQRTASLVFGVPLEEVTEEMRRVAKTINFGILYGMGINSLIEATKLPPHKAEEFLFTYFQKFKVLNNFLEGLKEQARSLGFVETLFGRRRYLPEINSRYQELKSLAERIAINHPIQGTAAELIKLSMIKIHELLHGEAPCAKKFFQAPAFLILQIHDELLFEIQENRVDFFAEKIKNIMENIYPLGVPLKVEIKIGKNWGEL